MSGRTKVFVRVVHFEGGKARSVASRKETWEPRCDRICSSGRHKMRLFLRAELCLLVNILRRKSDFGSYGEFSTIFPYYKIAVDEGSD